MRDARRSKRGIISYLAERGLIFIEGFPPECEDGTLLVWTGGCNALVASWQGGKLLRWDDIEPIEVEEIVCWMRLPHPSIWPMIEMPNHIVPERDLYAAKTDVLTEFESR